MIIKIVLSILVSIVALYFAAHNVKWEELKLILSQARGLPIFFAVLISLLSFFTRAFRWQIILQPFQKIRILPLFRWQVGGLLINNLLPLRMGELARAYWTGHKSSISKSSVLATIVLERILDIGSLALLALLILTVLKVGGPLFTPLNLVIFATLSATALLGIKIYFRRLPQIPLREKVEKILPKKLRSFLSQFLSGLKVIKDRNEVLKLVLISIITWSIDITTIAIMARSLGIELGWFHGGFVIVGLVLGVMVPAAPGAAGTYEAGGVIALSLLGVEKTLAFSLILLIHAVQYIFVLIMGIPILISEGFNPKKFLRE